MSYQASVEIISILEKAGENLLKFWPGAGNTELQQELKADNTLVTEADTSTNSLLVPALLEVEGISKIYSEETGISGVEDAEIFWYLDPLDGTRQFAAGDDDFYILLSAINTAGRPVEAYVYQPINQKLVYAKLGEGAWLSFAGKEKPLVTSQDRQLNPELVMVRDCEIASKSSSQKLHTGTAQISIAEGGLQGCIYGVGYDGSPKSWDFAPFDLIISEAGGKVSDQDGNLLNYLKAELPAKQFVASNSKLHQQILKLLNE